MTQETHVAPCLIRLSDSGLTLEDPASEDIRGLDLYDTDGRQLGTVEDLYIDEEEHRVRFLDVTGAGDGLFGIGEIHRLIPIEAVKKASEEGVVVDQSGEKVGGSPPFDPNVVPRRNSFEDIYRYYGYARSGGRAGPGAWPGGL